jgi:hypothetical protein
MENSPTLGPGDTTQLNDCQKDFQMDPQPMEKAEGSILDFTVVSTTSDWLDIVIFESTRPTGSFSQHLQLSDSKRVRLSLMDSLLSTITATINLPLGLSPKPLIYPKPRAKRNIPFQLPN